MWFFGLRLCRSHVRTVSGTPKQKAPIGGLLFYARLRAGSNVVRIGGAAASRLRFQFITSVQSEAVPWRFTQAKRRATPGSSGVVTSEHAKTKGPHRGSFVLHTLACGFERSSHRRLTAFLPCFPCSKECRSVHMPQSPDRYD